MTNLSFAQFNGHNLKIIDHAGRKWLTAAQVGQCLGYADANAGTGISNIYNRHADEFTEADSWTINLIVQGQRRSTRIFSDTGCQLLGFFASTPKAKDFRAWAKKVLAAHAPDAQRMALLEQALLQARPQWGQLMRFRAMGLNGRQIALLLGVGHSTQEKMVRSIRASALGHLLPATARPPVGRRLAAVDAAQMQLEV